LGFEFPNLPYIIDGDKKLTESDAIQHYICIKSGHKELLGKTDDDIVKLALVRGVLNDARTAVMRAVYNKDYATMIDGILKDSVFPKLDGLNKHVGKGEGLTGTGLTYIDFLFYEFAQLLLTMDSKMFEKYENLTRLISHIENLEAIKKYHSSERFQKRPFNGGPATYQPL